MSDDAVTCQVRYTLELSQLSAFETYARVWMLLIERYGGVHHGYFVPRTSPDVIGPSFPGLGYDGPSNVALAIFTFPNEQAYRSYREAVTTEPECQAMAALVQDTHCFTRYERLFLRPVAPEDKGNRPQ